MSGKDDLHHTKTQVVIFRDLSHRHGCLSQREIPRPIESAKSKKPFPYGRRSIPFALSRDFARQEVVGVSGGAKLV